MAARGHPVVGANSIGHRRKAWLPLAVWLCLAVTPTFAQTRVALVTSCDTAAARDLLALAEVKLSHDKDIALVERSQIGRVLAEQKLSHCGPIDSEQAIAAGKLLGAELFAVVEVAPDGPSALGLVVFDAVTGSRLWDTAFPTDEIAGIVDAIAADVAGARLKRQRISEGVKTVCVLSVRNAELPREMDSYCESIGRLLERQLSLSPNLAMLERKRLEHLNRERALPIQGAVDLLLASLVVIDLEVERAAGGKGLRVTAFLTDGSGQKLGKAACDILQEDAFESARLLGMAVAKELHVAPSAIVANRPREAERFVREAEFLSGHGDIPGCVKAAEAAAALDPESAPIRSLLARSLLSSALATLGGPLDNLKHSLAVAGRAVELGTVLPSSSENDLMRVMDSTYLCQPFTKYLRRAFSTELRNDVEALQMIRTLRETYRDFLVSKVNPNAVRLVHDANDMQSYSKWLGETALKNTESLWPNSRDWVGDVIVLYGGWFKLAERFPPSWDIEVTVNRMLARLTCRDHAGRGWKLRDEDRMRLAEFYRAMEKHPDQVVRLYGTTGLLWLDLSDKTGSSHDAVDRVRAIRLLAQKSITELATEPTKNYRVLLYNAALDAIALLPEPEMRRTGYGELLEFMLRRHEIAYGTLYHATNPRENTYRFYHDMKEEFTWDKEDTIPREHYPQLLDTYTRILAMVDASDVRILDASVAGVKGTLTKFRGEVLAARPELAPKAVAPWRTARELFDIFRHNGIERIIRLQIVGDAVYGVVVGKTVQPGCVTPLQLVRIPLGGGEIAFLGKTEQPCRFWPPNFLQHLFVDKAACVYEGSYYLATSDRGVLVFPLNSGPVRSITSVDGLPSDKVHSVACLDGKLYAVVGDTYLVRYDINRKSFEVISSTRRKEKRNALDDLPSPFVSLHMIADPEHHRILFAVEFPGETLWEPAPASLNGLWEINGETGAPRQLLEVPYIIDWVSPIRGNQLWLACRRWALGSYDAVIAFDLATDKAKLVSASKPNPAIEKVTESTHVIPIHNQVWPPYLLVDGWLWSAVDFGRISPDGKTQELFPPLGGRHSGFSEWELLEAVGTANVVAADRFSVWLLTLPAQESGAAPDGGASPRGASKVSR